MIRDPRLGSDFRLVIANDHAVVEIMGMGINISVVGDGTASVNDELAAIIQQNVFVDGAIVLDRQVVAE